MPSADEVVAFVLDRVDEVLLAVEEFAVHDEDLLREAHRKLLQRLTTTRVPEADRKGREYYRGRSRDSAAHDVLVGLVAR